MRIDAQRSTDRANTQAVPLDLVCCPVTGSDLRLTTDADDRSWLVSERGALRYPVVGGIPMLTPQAAILPDGCSTVEDAIAAHPG